MNGATLSKFAIFSCGLLLGAALGATFHKETVVVREGTANTPAAMTSVNLMIDYGNGTIRTWNTVSWHEAMSIEDLLKQGADAKEFTLDIKIGNDKQPIIQAIDGISNDVKTGMRWQYWVDNKYEPRNSSKYYLKPGDIVLWKYVKDQEK